eukprot:TRINITY_DN5012_c0_g1_i1.p1 TRINITY_DN5012_c0_g1~~TRINITY_DN5012_c0_g1_i1.p1  ORF type:complete len:353 (-),score=36.11 TRINITY_DN5012_c0_g1_i1:58-1095(-)
MSHSSGISVSQALRERFGEALDSSKIRLIKAQIKDNEIDFVSNLPSEDLIAQDFDKIPSFLDPCDPCYILFRCDDVDANGVHLWMLMCYVPDKSKVRDKMTYASSRSNLRLQLGSNRFTDEVFGTVPGDFNEQGISAYKNMKSADVPLTWTEQQAIQDKEGGVFVGGSGTAHVHGIAFPVDDAANTAVKGLLSGQHNLVQLAIDVKNERIVLHDAKQVTVPELCDLVPLDVPLFHLFSFEHQHDNQTLAPIIFVYSCPDGSGPTKSAPVRLRMLYSSSKANVEGIITSMGGNVALKLEINQGTELDENSLLLQLHPDKPEEKKAFSKPKGPSKGGKRLIRSDKKE